MRGDGLKQKTSMPDLHKDFRIILVYGVSLPPPSVSSLVMKKVKTRGGAIKCFGRFLLLPSAAYSWLSFFFKNASACSFISRLLPCDGPRTPMTSCLLNHNVWIVITAYIWDFFLLTKTIIFIFKYTFLGNSVLDITGYIYRFWLLVIQWRGHTVVTLH